ncbi:hypothetical protein D9758_006629 [Tetrapyrgos nigripes]|uniref:Cytochrome P450 n=1 Tax=Tetrapyrgos nigripes TaxID=182062 RepID=A0A8H5GJS9_9AGAR|nr:hypothetical protein D9758_006629 [Tetrapyrgos nigripes]
MNRKSIQHSLEAPLEEAFELKEEYGPIVHFHGFGNSILVLNDYKTMIDLLVKKGNMYCSRPYFHVACNLMDLIKSTAFAPFGTRWRLHRKLARVALNPEALKTYEPRLMEIAAMLVQSLAARPDDFINHARLAAGQVIMSTMYGLDISSPEDPYIVRAEAAMSIISKAVVPGEFLVDLIPSMGFMPSWVPFTRFHKIGRQGRELIAELVEKPYQFDVGADVPSFTREVLTEAELQTDRAGNNEEFEDAVKWAAASMYAAGQEVISSAIINLIMGLALNPDKGNKAQAEIDKVIGDRLLTPEDRQILPYCDALVKETLRWHLPLPMDIARASIEDDVYNGYFIPRGTIVIPNVWSIAHAPDPDFPPNSFIPERFLSERANTPLDPSLYVFGFGRRICPGRLVAENFVFIMSTTIIRSFDIRPAKNPDGSSVPIDVEYSSGLVSLPEPFRCSISSRMKNTLVDGEK